MIRKGVVPLLAALTVFAAPTAAHAAYVPKCGVYKFHAPGDPSDGTYYSDVTHRHAIKCGRARNLVELARKEEMNAFVCTGHVKFHGWTIRHHTKTPAQSGKWTKGNKSFIYTEGGGAC